MVFLLAVPMFLGLRDRIWRGSTHMTLFVITCITLGLVFLRLGR
jgi:hypothetical protein